MTATTSPRMNHLTAEGRREVVRRAKQIIADVRSGKDRRREDPAPASVTYASIDGLALRLANGILRGDLLESDYDHVR